MTVLAPIGGRVTAGLTLLAVSLLVTAGAAMTGAARPVPVLGDADRIRIAEAFRLARALGDRLWPGWTSAPFAVLLVTPDQEFLVRHPKPTPDFARLGNDDMLGTAVWSRPRQFDVNLLASFPAVGDVPSIVIGQPANTAATTSTRWVLTLLHEHFHQWQYSLPGYYPGVNALGLARGGQQGSWMLSYPFPYGKPDVQAQFALMCARLDEALTQEADERMASVRTYLDAKRALRRLVSADDYKYLSFQLWQEGIARYTEYRIGDLAASGYAPLPAFARLPDFATYAEASRAMLERIHAQLTSANLGEAERSAFYPVGAAEGLLLDRVNPGWRAEYATAGFTLDGLLDRK